MGFTYLCAEINKGFLEQLYALTHNIYIRASWLRKVIPSLCLKTNTKHQ